MFDLGNRVALVTGAGRGIGAGIARLLARQGAAVGVNDIDAASAESSAQAIRDAGGQAIACVFDAADYTQAESRIAALVEAFGPVDILVNNAGGAPGGRMPASFLKTPRESWSGYMDMNFNGVLNCTHIVAAGMAERGYGRVVSITSDSARLGHHGSSIYGAAKAGVEGFMRTLAKELGPRGVTANSVALGLVNTAPAQYLAGLEAEKYYATRRIGTPDDVAAGVLYLVSEEASWVTGHTLVINGGFLGA
jgi:NAD(P)-dependent dehydrogenase (short-subunit alcohol dehydrogenase family)